MLFCCFFLQAEDGIRDYKVTGVQTCALPIYIARIAAGGIPAAAEERLRTLGAEAGQAFTSDLSVPEFGLVRRAGLEPIRSEERRVGKEGRSRWAPDH